MKSLNWTFENLSNSDVPLNNGSWSSEDEVSLFYQLIALKNILRETMKNPQAFNQTLSDFLSNETFMEQLKKGFNLNLQEPSRQLSNHAWILIPMYATIFLLSVIGNSLVILTLLQNKRMRTPMNVLLFNLAISDLLLGVVCMPFTLTGFLLRDFVFGAILCRIIPYLQAVSVAVSAYTLVTISLERYLGICFPLQMRRWGSLKHAYKMISLVWGTSFLFAIPIPVTSELLPVGNSGRHKCREEWVSQLGEQIFNIYLVMILLIFPLCLMVTVYFKISRALWQHIINEREPGTSNCSTICSRQGEMESPISKRHRTIVRFKMKLNGGKGSEKNSSSGNELEQNETSETVRFVDEVTETEKHSPCPISRVRETILRKSNTKKSLQSKKRIIKMLFVVVLEFFICWTPLYVINTISLFDPPAVYNVLGMGGISAVQLLAYCSSFCNPITYCFMSASFRSAFLSAVSCRKSTLYENNIKVYYKK